MKRYRAIVWAGLAAVLMSVWPHIAITLSSAGQLKLSDQIAWCETRQDRTIVEVAAGACNFKLASQADLARGFSDHAFWLRLDLYNPTPHDLERWLQVGHPRLEDVSLFELNKDHLWQRIRTGTRVPIDQRPIITAFPILPIILKMEERKTLYIRVESQSAIDLTPTLWEKDSYIAVRHRVERVQFLLLGSVLTSAFFSLMVYLIRRDLIYLYFGATLLCEIVFDLSYGGLWQLYVWPAHLPFDLRLLPLAVGSTMLFFVLFIRQFIGNMQRYRRYDILMLTSLTVLILAVLWSCLVHYGDAIRVIVFAIPVVLLSGIALFYRSWREGSSAAGYLFASYTLLLLMASYRITEVFGVINSPDVLFMGFSWRILMITPIILAGIAQHSEELRDALRQAAGRIQFLAQMSHEFRTPLNIIMGYAELLERNSQRITVHEGASSIKRSGRYLLGMIDEILDHARGEAGKLTLSLTPVCWASFLEALKQSTMMLLEARDNTFVLQQEGGLPERVMLDERRVRQILDILLSNANRYTRHGTITLHCNFARVYHTQCRFAFSVSDTGAGIAAQEMETIFQPFVRGSAGQSSGIDGVGMGLAVARQLVTLMGGELSVESRLGEGSQFSFSIECELAPAQALTTVKPWQGKLSQTCSVLLIDDDALSVKLLTILLADYGFKLITAHSGNAARCFLDDHVDLVITDQFMSDGDGWDVLKDWARRQVPVILLSAAPAQRPPDFPRDLHFARLQLKPLNADTLLNDISDLLRLSWEPVSSSTPADQMPRPPAELLTPLNEMIEAGAVTDMSEWLACFAQQHPEYRAYCEKMDACNLSLNFAALRNLMG